MMILQTSLINILLIILAQIWPAKLNVSTKIQHSIFLHLQLIVLLCLVSQKLRFSNLFKTLDINKSSIDIPTCYKLIKLAAKPFTKIDNQSIEAGIVPNILKVSRVTPVY